MTTRPKGVLALALGLAVALPAASLAGPPAPLAPGDIRQITFLPSPTTNLVAVRLEFRGGSQYDPPGKEGLAALTAAMVSQGGTRNLNYQDVLARLYPMASSISGTCHKEVTVFSGEVHKDNALAYVELISDMVSRPRFDRIDFDRVKEEAIETLTKSLRAGNDEELGKWTLQLSLYPPKHPYGHVDTGTVQGLKSITIQDVISFHRFYYTKPNLHLGVAGGDENLIKQLAVRLQGLDSSFFKAPALPAVEKPEGLNVTIVEKPTAATAISMGFPIDVTRKDDDFYSLLIANSYLGEHRTFNGKLMQDLRGKRGLNYGDYSYVEDFIQDGFGTFPVPNNPRRQQAFSIWVRPVPHDKAVFALRAALWEFQMLYDKGMSSKDFEATRSFLLNYSKLWVQTLPRRLGYKMDGSFYDKDSLVAEIEKRLPKLSVEQVNEAIKNRLKTKGFHVAIVTQDAKALEKALTSGAASPITYDTKGTPDDILAEDKVIAEFPLGKPKVKIVPVGEMFEK